MENQKSNLNIARLDSFMAMKCRTRGEFHEEERKGAGEQKRKGERDQETSLGQWCTQSKVNSRACFSLYLPCSSAAFLPFSLTPHFFSRAADWAACPAAGHS